MSAVIVGIYFVLPVPNEEGRRWLVLASIILIALVYVGAGYWSVVRINRAKHPIRVGAILLTLMFSSVVVIFALIYLLISANDPSSFTTSLDKINSLYFTMTILSTTGFGDITAVSDAAMIAVMVQMVVGLTLITAFARVIVESARRAAKRKLTELD